MKNDIEESTEKGYALIDALVGIALAGIVLLAASRGLTQLSQARQLTLSADERRYQTETLVSTLARLFGAAREAGGGGASSGTVGNPRALSFAIADFSSGDGRFAQVSLLVSQGRDGRSELHIRREGQTGATSDVLINGADAIELSYIVEASDGTREVVPEIPDFLGLHAVRITIGDIRMGNARIVAISYPRYFRAICIAQPYLRECLP